MTPAKIQRAQPHVLANNPRCTLDAWTRYSIPVLAAYAQHPVPYLFTMPGLSVQTVTSKLRDAVRGAIAFAYCTEPSVEDLTNWWSKVIVRPEGEQVHIGPRTPLKETYTTESAAPKTGFVFDTLTAEETQAFALLLNNGRISGPITIRKPKHEPVLSALFNVDIVRLKNGHLQII